MAHMLKLIVYRGRGMDTLFLAYDGSLLRGECSGSYCMPDEWSREVADMLRLYEEARMLEDALFNKYDVIVTKASRLVMWLDDPETRASLHLEYQHDTDSSVVVTLHEPRGDTVERLRQRILTARPGRLPDTTSITIYCEDAARVKARRLWSRGCEPRSLLERGAASTEARREVEELLAVVTRLTPYAPLVLRSFTLKVGAPGYSVTISAGESSTSVRVEVYGVQRLTCRRCLEAGREALRSATHLLASSVDYSLA